MKIISFDYWAKPLLLAQALTVCAWVPVQAQTFEQSLVAHERQNYGKAFTGFKKLAAQGEVRALHNLGVMYSDGQGVPKDERQAVEWTRKAAEQGLADAQANLGFMYDNGKGVPRDLQMAYFWYLLASAQGDQEAVKVCDVVEHDLSPVQRATAQASARSWRPKTAGQFPKTPRSSAAWTGFYPGP